MLGKVLTSKYPSYPIYGFTVKWIQDGKHDPKYPESFMYRDVPEGRINNSTYQSKIFKEEQTDEVLTEFITKWWDNLSKQDRHKDLNVELTELKVEFLRYETWNLTWFSHETFDVGQTDQEALDSFEEYVERIEQYNSQFDELKGQICLMGAEDRWRWCGSTEEGRSDMDIPAPCRCQGCKDAGMLRINH